MEVRLMKRTKRDLPNLSLVNVR